MKVVLDTNILVSGLLWLGPSNKILRLAEEGKIESCFSPDLFEELHQVLKRQKFISRIKALKTSIEELIAGISDTLELFPDTKIPGVIKEDPDDDRILSCAWVSGAEYIVTGDPHLLKLGRYRNIPIVTPRKFLTLVSPMLTRQKLD